MSKINLADQAMRLGSSSMTMLSATFAGEENAETGAAEVQRRLKDDVPVVMMNGMPVLLGSIRLVDGILVDGAGRPAETLKPHIWY